MKYKHLSLVNVLLSAGAIIHNPQLLFNFLQSQDQRDPCVLSSLEILCKQLKNNNHYPMLLGRVQVYFEKLKKITKLYRNELTNSDFDLSSKIKFFKPKDIDLMIEQAKKKNFLY